MAAQTSVNIQEIIQQLAEWQARVETHESLVVSIDHRGAPNGTAASWDLRHDTELADLAGKIKARMERDVRELRGAQTFYLCLRSRGTREIMESMPFSVQNQLGDPLGSSRAFDLTEGPTDEGGRMMWMRHANDDHRLRTGATVTIIQELRQACRELSDQLQAERVENARLRTQNALVNEKLLLADDRKAARDWDIEKQRAELESTQRKWEALTRLGLMFAPSLAHKFGVPMDIVRMVMTMITANGAPTVLAKQGAVAGMNAASPPAAYAAPSVAAPPSSPSAAGPHSSASAAPTSAPVGSAVVDAHAGIEALLRDINRDPPQKQRLLGVLTEDQRAHFAALELAPTSANLGLLAQTITEEQLPQLMAELDQDQITSFVLLLQEVLPGGDATPQGAAPAEPAAVGAR